MITIEKAITSLGNYQFIIRGDCNTEKDFNTKIEWIKSVDEQGNQTMGSKPSDLTWDKVNTKWQELKTEYTNNKYQRDRAVAYPSIQDQLDMQYWDKVNSTTTWQTAIAKVKLDNPKG